MTKLYKLILASLIPAFLSCNFSKLDRKVCNDCSTSGAFSLARISFFNLEDGSDRFCVNGEMDWNMRTFDLTPWAGASDAMFANGTSLAGEVSRLTGQTWEYVRSDCSLESTSPGAVDATTNLARPTCSPAPIIVYTFDATTDDFTLNSVTTTPATTDWAANVVATSDIVEINGSLLHPAGTVVASYGAGSLLPVGGLTTGTSVALPGGEYEIRFMSDSCSYNETANLESLKPFVSVAMATAVNRCIQDSGLQIEDELQLNFNGMSSTSSGFEQIAQVSKNAGVTWLGQSSFSGAATWLPVPNMGNTTSISTALESGDWMRHCIREIGDTSDGLCDVKIVPDPSASVDPGLGTILLTNSTVETNTCYTGDEYSVTLWGYASTGALVETCDLPAYDPLTDAPDLSGCPAEILKVVSAGIDGNTLRYDPSLSSTVDFVHARNQIKQTYDCDGTACDTSLLMSDDSFAYTLDESQAIDFDTTFNLFASYITAAPGPDFRLHMFKEGGTKLVTYAAGSLYTQGVHFSADSTITSAGGSEPTVNNYPLVGGTYYPALELPTSVEPLKPICIDSWDLCTRQANYSYTGFPIIAGVDYLAPASAAMSEMQSQFSSHVVPDQAVVTDCNGSEVYNSNLVSATDVRVTSPVDPTGLGCNILDVNVFSGGTPTQITIYDLALGCCNGGSCNKELPRRDPIVERLIHNIPPATPTYSGAFYVLNPHVKQSSFGSANLINSNICYRENLDNLVPQSCLWDNDSLTRSSNRFLERCSESNSSRTQGSPTSAQCLEFTLDSERTESVNGNVVTLDFVDSAAYSKAVAFFAAIESEIPATWETAGQKDLIKISFTGNTYKASACLDDGTIIRASAFWYYQSGLPVFDAANNRITMDFTGLFQTLPTGQCFNPTLTDASLANTWLDPNLQQMNSSWNRQYLRSNTLRTAFFVPVTASDASTFSQVFDIGINNSICANNNPVQPYTFVVNDRADWLNSWYFYRGDEATGTLLQAHDNSGLADNIVAPSHFTETADGVGGCRSTLRIENEDGFSMQEIDWANVWCDLSYYGGGLEQFPSGGPAFATRLEGLIGGGRAITHVSHYDLFTVSPFIDNLRPITCK